MDAERLLKVRLGKADYLIPYERLTAVFPSLMRITSHPLDPQKLIVWRQMKLKVGVVESRDVALYEASKSGNRIEEGRVVANMRYRIIGKNAHVWDFKVDPTFRKKTMGSALRETMLQHLKKEGVKDVGFPLHEEAEFYTKRGLKRVPGGYLGKVKELGVKPAGIKLKVLWQRSRPRF